MKVVAHRGASGELPEHTMGAYELALRQGADGYECDVRLTADHQLVCFHDRSVARTCVDAGRPRGLISQMTLAELRGLNFGTVERPAGIVTLRELLDFFFDAGGRDGQELFIETKHPNRFGAAVEWELFKELEARGAAGGGGGGGCAEMMRRVHVLSFNPSSLWRFRGLSPRTHRILLRREFQKVMNPALERAGVVHSHGVSLARGKVRPDIIGRFGRGTYMWTVDQERDVMWAKARGVDWLATNFPGMAVQWRDV
ncbi:glycerophosphodiester phosphodiesterase [Corynebacterium sp. zg254]|uniref:glycerophosphodiester phosphodiesterase family protein n=1 Tax=Corynebacterium sp. zg254 TaxID=2656645 RepID=UPI002151E4EB|nr:glycerophosphodiester phosphodiesterase family protein [Corynebacterium sp. zg254]MCR5914163.1 glycerophosphodiester phosphodiesterase [Corynebacterium sp. zg254]